jgi:hypothetical protein
MVDPLQKILPCAANDGTHACRICVLLPIGRYTIVVLPAPIDSNLSTWDRFVKLVINQFMSTFTVTPSSKPTLGDDTTAPEDVGNNTILAAHGEGVMSAVVHNGILARAGGLSTGGAGLGVGAPDNIGGVSLVARTLGDDDALAKGGDTLAACRGALFMAVNSGHEEPRLNHTA